jgi:hypothetical protein
VERGLLLSGRECPDRTRTPLAAKHEAELLGWAQAVRMVRTERRAGLLLGKRAKQVAGEIAISAAGLAARATYHNGLSEVWGKDDRGDQTKTLLRAQVGFPQMPQKTIFAPGLACK